MKIIINKKWKMSSSLEIKKNINMLIEELNVLISNNDINKYKIINKLSRTIILINQINLPDEIILKILSYLDILKIIEIKIINKQFYRCCNTILSKSYFNNLFLKNIHFKKKIEKIDIFYNNEDLIFEPKLFFRIYNYHKIGLYDKMGICFYDNTYYTKFINDINQIFIYIYEMNKDFVSSFNIANNISTIFDFGDNSGEKHVLNIFTNDTSKFYNYKNQKIIHINELTNLENYCIYPIIQIKNLNKNKKYIYINCLLKEGYIIFKDDIINHDIKFIKSIYETYLQNNFQFV